MTCRVDAAPHDVEPRPYSLTADWLGLGPRGSATTGGYRVLCPFQNPDKPGTITDVSRGAAQPRTMVWQSSIHIALSLIGCAARRARDTRRGHRPTNEGRRSDAPDEDRAPSPFQKSFHYPSNPRNRGRKPTSPGSIHLLHGVESLAS